jgi:hypothetical protein
VLVIIRLSLIALCKSDSEAESVEGLHSRTWITRIDVATRQRASYNKIAVTLGTGLFTSVDDSDEIIWRRKEFLRHWKTLFQTFWTTTQSFSCRTLFICSVISKIRYWRICYCCWIAWHRNFLVVPNSGNLALIILVRALNCVDSPSQFGMPSGSSVVSPSPLKSRYYL